MKKLLKTLACSAVAALVGASALADYGWYGGAMSIGGTTTDCTAWSTDGNNPTDLGDLTDMTISGIDFNVWSDANDRGGANMYFRIWDGGSSPVGSDQDLWLGASTRIEGDHNFSISWTGTEDLAAAVGLNLEHEHTYYIDMWAKTYGDFGDEWYSGGGANFHAKLTYRTPQTITFNVNGEGASCPIPSVKCGKGGMYTNFLPAVWDRDHTFLGWFDAQEGGNRVKMGMEVTEDDARTLWAHWGGPRQLVHFDANGGTCTMTLGKCFWDGVYGGLKLPVRDDFTFLGWYDALEGGTRVRNGDPVTEEYERTLYARWGQTVLFDANGGTASVPSKTAIVGGSYTKFATATLAGSSFMGWFDAREGGSRVRIGDPVTEEAERTLYAQWGDLRQTVYFDANGGTCTKASMKCVIGETYSGFKAPTWDGHKFLGWFDAKEGGTRVKNGMEVTEDLTRTVYAHWQETAAVATASKAFRAARGTTMVKDTLDRALTGQTSTSYNSWSGKTNQSDAVYAGNSAGGNSSIQLRSNNSNSGIVTTKSGGKARKVTIDWNSNTQAGRTNNIYGKNTAYTAASDLYGANAGTLIGTIVCGTSTNLSITDDYEYIGIRSDNGALYMNKVEIEWEVTTTGQSVTLSPSGPINAVIGDEVTIAATPDGFGDATVTWSWTVDGAAAASTGSTFTWDTAGLTAKSYVVKATATAGELTASAEATVNLTAPKHTITIASGIEHGTVTTTPSGEASEGATVTVNASPAAGYQLGSITVNDIALDDGVTTFTMPTENVTVSATFVAFDGDVLTLDTTGVSGSSYTNWTATVASGTKYAGTSAANNGNIQLNASSSTSKRGIVITESNGRDVKSVSLEWGAAPGTRTIQIYGSTNAYSGPADLSGDAKGTLLGTLTSNQTTLAVSEGYPYIGIYAPDGAVYVAKVSIAFAALPPSVTLSPSGTQEVYVGDPAVTITATAENFSGPVTWSWTVNGTPVDGSSAATYTVGTSVAEDYVITATATAGTTTKTSDPVTVKVKPLATAHDVEIETDGNGTLTADPNPAMEGQTVTLTAVPNEGYRLDSILSDDVEITDMSFVMPDDDVYLAAFFEGKHDVVIDDQIVNGSVEASPATAFSDETVTLTVQPDAGYKLGNLTVLDGDANEIPVTDMSFAMPKGDAYVFATFAEIVPHDVVVFVNGEGTAEADVDSAYEGETVTLTVNPGAGYKLQSIVVNDEPITGLSFVMPDDDAAVVVTFVEKGPEYVKITSLKRQLRAGQYVITGEKTAGEEYAMLNSISGSSTKYIDRRTDAVAFDEDGAITNADANIVWTLAKTDAGWTIYQEGFGYVGYVATGNSSGVETNASEKSTWTIAESGDNDGLFKFTNVGDDTRSLKYNSGNPRFACYTNGQKNVALYRKSAPIQTVTFDLNDGGAGASCPADWVEVDIGDVYTNFLPAVWDQNHTFMGWFDAREGGNRVKMGMEVTEDDARTLYAQWGGPRQLVHFDANGGTCTMTLGKCFWDGVYGGLKLPVRDGFTFLGWYDALEGGTRVRNGDPVTEEYERTLYARWGQTVLFDANGGTASVPSKTAIVGGAYTKFATATLDGSSFMGWFDAREGGNRVRIGDPVTEEAERTLYAQWGDLRQTVYFDANGGTCTKTSMKCVIGETYSGFKTPFWDGHKFLGWFDAKEGGTRVKNGMEVTEDLTRTVYAHWQEGVAALSISGFSVSPRAATRGAGTDTVEYTLRFETVADVVYEVQWTPVLGGEWTVLKRWVADEDGETDVTVAVPAASSGGFFRLNMQ